MWKAGKQHGKGIYTNAEGISKEGEWSEGKKVRWIADELKEISKK